MGALFYLHVAVMPVTSDVHAALLEFAVELYIQMKAAGLR